MRKIPAAIAVLSLAAVGLTGCSLPGASGCTRPGVPDQDVMDLVAVSGGFGAEPSVDVYTPVHTEQTSFQDDVTGDGTAIISDAKNWPPMRRGNRAKPLLVAAGPIIGETTNSRKSVVRSSCWLIETPSKAVYVA